MVKNNVMKPLPLMWFNFKPKSLKGENDCIIDYYRWLYRRLITGISPLGGTASRQRGFLGCLRALTINGVTLDLYERAKTTPGVNSGCPGHCSSDSACHNGGRCVEERSGYTCDCTQTAFDGPHCRTGEAAVFTMTSGWTLYFRCLLFELLNINTVYVLLNLLYWSFNI